jgi:hypothetical protein
MSKDRNVKERTHGEFLEHIHDGYELWHPAARMHAKMGACDLCNTEISIEQSKIVPPKELREAIGKGFRPANTNARAEALKVAGFVVDAKTLDDGWVAIAMLDESAWAFCDACAERFEKFIVKK